MTSVKCSQCGFVSARSNEECKRCGAAFTTASGNAQRKVGPRETKVAACIVIAIVTLVLGIRFTFSLLGSKNPAPSELASLLSSVEAIKSPITVQVVNERTDTAKRGDLTEEAFLPKSGLAQVLKKLGLATLEVTHNKADKQKCYRFDYKILSNAERNNRGIYDYSDPPITLNPNGYHEKCYDVWNYKTTVTLKDPTTVDRASIIERLWTLNNINDPSPDPAL